MLGSRCPDPCPPHLLGKIAVLRPCPPPLACSLLVPGPLGLGFAESTLHTRPRAWAEVASSPSPQIHCLWALSVLSVIQNVPPLRTWHSQGWVPGWVWHLADRTRFPGQKPRPSSSEEVRGAAGERSGGSLEC